MRPLLEQLEDRLTPTAGLLDPTFGAGTGYVLSLFPNHSYDSATAVAVQSDGKSVIAGTTPGGFLVARYNADGSLDTSFATGGYTVTGFGKGVAGHGQAIAIQSDGKILAGGYAAIFAHNGFTTNNTALARYNANGTLDTTFGNNGEVVTAGTGNAGSIVVQADGKILESGSGFLVRYNANGTLDTTFGNGGTVVTNFSGPLLIQPDGKIVIAGSSVDPANGQKALAVARFNADGTADSSFGSGGEVFTDGVAPTQPEGLSGVALQADGKIVANGTDPSFTKLSLVRYNADGTLDTTFGSSGNGIATVPVPAGYSQVDSLSGVEVQSNGKIIAGAMITSPSGYETFGAVRVNADGSVDTSYGNGGWATVYASSIQFAAEYSEATVLQPDGKLLLAGTEHIGTGSTDYVALFRFTGDTTAASFSVTGFPSSVTAGAAGTLTVTALNPDGSVNTGYTGTVHFTSSDPHAVLPADYTFTAADQGVHTFSATLVTAGSQSIMATDTTTSTMIGSDFGIVVQPAAASQFILSAPSSVKHGSAFSLTLTVEDAFGNVVTGYIGTVHFSSSDSSATLPADYTFTASDAGVHTFTSTATLRKRGTQTVSVTDTQNSSLSATDTISVS